MIKYLGSKRRLLTQILETVRAADPEARSVLDMFSGTSRVGHALKAQGYRVLSNDHNAYAATLARCYVAADRDDWLSDAEQLVREFNALAGAPGWFTDTFCERSRFFQPRNGARVDAIREAIAAKSLPPELEAVMLVSLMEAADRVDSTTGVQMAYLKQWAPRAENELELRVPDLLPRATHGKGEAHELDAQQAARTLVADVAYLDPPYNQHSYLGNYHVWESLVRWDQPEVYGVACKRVDCRDRRSAFNSKPRSADAFRQVIDALRARTVIVSFNDEGYLARDELERTLSTLWQGAAHVDVFENDSKRYVGAQIGIHSPSGEKVGTVGRLRNKELLYVATRGKASVALSPSRPSAP
ncbi:MAG: restriction endonuclease subunit M [Planctomycetota bacterium]|nr:MAG: restriction endonuclease subunit M [Planctomycetota bacterium]